MSQHALKSVWRLGAEGEWTALSENVSERFASVAEMVSLMVSSELGDGAELQARFGDQTLEVRSGGGQVTTLLRGNDLHPLVIKTALQRVELASVRSSRIQHSVDIGLHRPPVRSFRLDEDAPDTPFRASSNARRLATAPNGGPLITTSDELCDIEIDMLQPETDADAAMAPACTWRQTCTWIEQAIQWSARSVGRSVASNYWRELLRSEMSISASPVVAHDGRVSVSDDSDARLSAGDARTLDTLFEEWLRRCGRVMPNVAAKVEREVSAPPWRKQSNHSERSTR